MNSEGESPIIPFLNLRAWLIVYHSKHWNTLANDPLSIFSPSLHAPQALARRNNRIRSDPALSQNKRIFSSPPLIWTAHWNERSPSITRTLQPSTTIFSQILEGAQLPSFACFLPTPNAPHVPLSRLLRWQAVTLPPLQSCFSSSLCCGCECLLCNFGSFLTLSCSLRALIPFSSSMLLFVHL